MWPWRIAIISVSLVQVGLGLACFGTGSAGAPATFGLVVCGTVGGLGLLTQATAFLRVAAVQMNSLLFMACLPPLIGGSIDLFIPPPGPPPIPAGVYAGVIAMALACFVNVLGLSKLSAKAAESKA
jgi:hypothetical protein